LKGAYLYFVLFMIEVEVLAPGSCLHVPGGPEVTGSIRWHSQRSIIEVMLKDCLSCINGVHEVNRCYVVWGAALQCGIVGFVLCSANSCIGSRRDSVHSIVWQDGFSFLLKEWNLKDWCLGEVLGDVWL